MKYEYKADPYSSHAKIINIIRKKGDSLTILDVGCAAGYIGRELGKTYSLTGIEIDKEVAHKAKKHYKKVIIADLDTYQFKGKELFDVIICGDILEHLKDPVSVLKMLNKNLEKNGIIIISLPNIALLVLRLKLLFGNFDYADKGPMDKTHVHFYTLKTARQLINQAGLRTRKYYATPVPLPLVFPFIHEGSLLFFIHALNNFFTQWWKKLFAYQFVFVASR